MDTVQRWSGREAKALREALRMSVRAFAAHLGISERTVSKWEAGGQGLIPVPDSQALLDTALARASGDVRERFRPASADPQKPAGDGCSILAPSLEPGLIHRSDDHNSLLAILSEASNEDPTQAVAVTGPGGFGKTTLVTQVIHDPHIQHVFPEILWVETGEDCTPVRIVELISDLCVHLGGARPALTDPEQAGFHLARVIGDRRVLLIIDNVWSAADLSPFLLAAPRYMRLVTTRNVRVCPSATRIMRLGSMSPTETAELLSRTFPSLSMQHVAPLAELCGGWPLLATVVGANIGHDVDAGASPSRAIEVAGEVLRNEGPQAFDAADADEREHAIGHAISSSLRSLNENVTIRGATDLRERYLSLAIFPAGTLIPIQVLTYWWRSAFGWDEHAVRQFCLALADRSLISAYRVEREAVVLHDVFRGYLRRLIGDQWASSHRSLIEAYRPATSDPWLNLGGEHEYLWRYLSYHLHEGDLDEELVQVLAAPHYLVTKATRCGYQSLATDHRVLQAAAPKLNENQLSQQFSVADTMTGSAHLLHDLTTRPDIASTLLVALERGQSPPDLVRPLRNIASETDSGFEVSLVQPADANGHDEEHIGAVVSVAAHGRLLVSGGEDGAVRLWDLDNRCMLHRCQAHTGWVYATAISADGGLVASAGEDTMIRLWGTRDGVAVNALVGHTSRVRALAFTHSGRVLVSGAEDGRICVWDVDQPSLLRQMSTTGCPVWSVSVGCDDTIVAAGGEDEFVRLFDLRDGQLLDEKAGHRDWVRSVAFASKSSTLVSGSGDRTVRLWNVAAQRLVPVRRIDITDARVRSVSPSDHADRIVAACEDATLRAFTTDGTAGQARMPAGVDWVRATALSREGSVVAGCEDGGLRLWQPSSHEQLAVLARGSDTVWSAALADSGNLALLGHGDGTINVYDAASTQPQRRWFAGPGRVWSLATGGDYAAAAGGDGEVRVWSLASHTELLRVNADVRRSWAVSVARTGRLLAASTGGGEVRVWELPSGKQLWAQHAQAGRIRSLAFDDDGGVLAAAGGDGIIRLWHASTGEAITRVASPSGWARTVTVDSGGVFVALGSGTGDIHICDINTGRVSAHLPGHTGRVLMLGLTRDGDRLASAAADGTVRLWSLSQQQQLAQVRVDASGQCAAFDPASERVVVGSGAGVAALTLTTR